MMPLTYLFLNLFIGATLYIFPSRINNNFGSDCDMSFSLTVLDLNHNIAQSIVTMTKSMKPDNKRYALFAPNDLQEYGLFSDMSTRVTKQLLLLYRLNESGSFRELYEF